MVQACWPISWLNVIVPFGNELSFFSVRGSVCVCVRVRVRVCDRSKWEFQGKTDWEGDIEDA